MSEMWSKMYIGLHVKYPLFLSDFNENLYFLYRFSKNPQISNFMKIRPQWEPSCSMQTDKANRSLFAILRTRLIKRIVLKYSSLNARFHLISFVCLSFNSENMKVDGWKILSIHSLKFSSAFFLPSTDMSSSK
jgi:hypothetical protein